MQTVFSGRKSIFLKAVFFFVFLASPLGLQAEENNTALDKFDRYDPIYFLLGNDPFHAKIQLSFRYRISKRLPGLNVAYTQKSLWDLESFSKPFKDTNFMPQIFYRMEFEEGRHRLDFGAQHESNGRSGFESRSLNTIYAKGEYSFMAKDQDSFTHRDNGNENRDFVVNLSAHAWAYVLDLSDNSDIRDFRGNSSLRLLVGQNNGLKLSSFIRGNVNTGKGNLEFDLSYPLPWLNFYLHGQIFTGYGDMLISYDQKETKYRLGLSLVR